MSWSEFANLLQGILPETPLGQIVSIRCEENKEILKYFTPDQHRIRNDWRAQHSAVEDMTNAEKEKDNAEIQELLRKAFG
ncbi:hypothetical protein SAMN04515624_105123 [Eubacterium maltosivorans]|nr:hypothetical protein EUMA32_12050 [Eubacterium maltosivorans]SDP01245.1 hypothetical protein SAMN04515624_105123 [Eubacterium maltosivorans]